MIISPTTWSLQRKQGLVFWFKMKNIDYGAFSYFYAQENNALLDRCTFVSTRAVLAKPKNFLNKNDVIESCGGERMNTKWGFYGLTNLTVFAALLKDVPMGCKDAVLPKPLLKNCKINCLTFGEDTRQPYNDNLSLFFPLLSI